MAAPVHDVGELVTAASELTGGPASLVDDLSFSNRAVVARVFVGSGQTVIAKKPFTTDALTSELEALRLLPARTRPELVGIAGGVVVMEDLGRGPSLADLLLTTGRDRAEAALYAWAGTVGRALRGTMIEGSPPAPVRLEEGLHELLGLAADLDVGVPVPVDADVQLIERTLSDRSPWLAYCPGDTCPDNNRVLADGTVRLFDFEGSGWRHAATEAAYCRAPFCTCWCVAAMPAQIITSMEAEFLHALDPPEAGDFGAATGLAAVSWTLLTFSYLHRFVIDGGPAIPCAPSTGRQNAVLRLAQMRSQEERLPALAALAGKLLETILLRWPEAGVMPAYPAFASAPPSVTSA